MLEKRALFFHQRFNYNKQDICEKSPYSIRAEHFNLPGRTLNNIKCVQVDTLFCVLFGISLFIAKFKKKKPFVNILLSVQIAWCSKRKIISY